MENKAKSYLAKYHSYSNAAEFIRSHGEEGFAFQDDKLDSLYRNENERIGRRLDKIADKWYRKYQETGITVNSDISDFY